MYKSKVVFTNYYGNRTCSLLRSIYKIYYYLLTTYYLILIDEIRGAKYLCMDRLGQAYWAQSGCAKLNISKDLY